MYTRVTMIMTELIASAAMEELIQMAQLGHPLWINSSDGSSALLNEDEYIRIFPREIVPGQSGYRCEASRERAVVNMNRSKLVEILMDVNQYSTVFSGIVSRATTQDVLSIGVAGNYNGALQVMNSETQVPSPLVPARTSTFARYCKKIVDGTWAVVDVSSDNLLGYSSVLNSCQRRPSGCLIQEMENGYSKVTWVEHVLVNDRGVHSLYKQLVKSGHAFEAKRWVATLDRQCQRHTSALAIITPNWITTQEWRTNILKMAERMVSSFCVGLSASTTHTWTSMITDEDDGVLMMTRKSVDDPGRPSGVVLVAATSFQLPVPPKRVFEFLCDKNCRNKWDILSNDDIVQEVAHITNGPDLRNSVSLLRSVDSSQSNMLILQESCIDSVASYLVYAPMDIVAMSALMNGDNPDYIALLPSGFAILPDGTNESIYGSILTVAFQILVDLGPTAKLCLRYVAAVNRLIVCTMERIKASLSLDNEPQMISSFFSS